MSRIPPITHRLVSLTHRAERHCAPGWLWLRVSPRPPRPRAPRALVAVIFVVVVLLVPTQVAEAVTPNVILTNQQSAALPACTNPQSGCVPEQTVQATMMVTQLDASSPGCDTLDLNLNFSGDNWVSGDQAPQRVAVPFTGPVRLQASVTYALTAGTQLVQLDASATCADETASPVKAISEFVTLPGWSTVTGALTPAPDTTPGAEVLNAFHFATSTATRIDTWAALAACGLARRGAGRRFFRTVCADLLSAAVGESVTARPSGSLGQGSVVPPGRFASRVFAKHGGSASFCGRGRRAASCRRVIDAWLGDLNEGAWLAAALAQAATRYRTLLHVTPSSDTSRDLAEQAGAMLVYGGRLAQLGTAQSHQSGALGRALGGSSVGTAITPRMWRSELRDLRSGRILPGSVLRAYAGLPIKAKEIIEHESLSRLRQPGSLAEVLDPVASDATALRTDGVRATPIATAALLGDWLGRPAANLGQLCGSSYATAITSLATGPAGHQLGTAARTYGLVLAATLLGPVRPLHAPRCIAHPHVAIAALPNWLSAQPGIIIPSSATAAGGLTQAQEFAAADDGSLLVADEGARQVLRYSAQGQQLGVIGAPGSGAGQFTSPVSVAVDGSGRVYVSDFGANRIDRFAPNGTFQLAWGSAGNGVAQFAHPAGVAWNRVTNQLIVADGGNGRLEAFDADGHFAWATSGAPGDPSYLSRPRGIAVAPDGTIAVANADLGRPEVARFSATGGYIGQTSPAQAYDPVSNPLGFIQPYAVAYDSAGHLWMADRGGFLYALSANLAVTDVVDAFTPNASAITPSALVFSGSTVWVLDFDGQQIMGFPTDALPMVGAQAGQ